MSSQLNRRQLFEGTAIVAGLQLLGGGVRADVPAGRDPFDYEVNKSDEEWLAQLGEFDYAILREGRTERPRSSPLWEETRAGTYSCKGCDLVQYTSTTKTIVDKGWVFFTAGEPNAQLMAQDTQAEMMEDIEAFDIFIEVHCRRCGSHMGHILPVNGKTLHCINGASLNYTPES